MKQRPILVDTNVIIECHAAGCWAVFAGAFRPETVEKCVEETQNGRQKRRPEQQIDEAALRRSLGSVHAVSEVQLAEVFLRGGDSIDEGERHLWAHALSRQDAWILCGPDRGSLRFGFKAGRASNLISLEELFTLQSLPYPKTLDGHYGRAWHGEQMTKLRLGIL